MSTYQYIRPIDQPTGAFRLIDWLEENFLSPDYNNFKCLVAFAKIKPFYKLHSSIQSWNTRGNQSEAVIGIDHKGTSYQALQYALANFDTVNILHVDYSTFHPKLYIFSGDHKATAYYGSSNFTSGGLETNFEGGVIINYTFPADQVEYDSLCNSYNSVAMPALACLTPLNLTSLNEMKIKGLLLDESKRDKTARSSASSSSTSGSASSSPSVFGPFTIKPARAIPKSLMVAAAASAGIVMDPVKAKSSKTKSNKHINGTAAKATAPSTPAPVVMPILADGFVIQVIPHHNGEILLSKVAVDQNRPFFGFPFTGATVPKKIGNPTYPQRVPDPIVNIRVFDDKGALANKESNYALNTIYYEKRSEIRITITPSILSALDVTSITTDYPILVMRISDVEGCDYDLDFYKFGSPVYSSYLSICDQSLPSGGKPVARRMGWI